MTLSESFSEIFKKNVDGIFVDDGSLIKDLVAFFEDEFKLTRMDDRVIPIDMERVKELVRQVFEVASDSEELCARSALFRALICYVSKKLNSYSWRVEAHIQFLDALLI